MRRSILGPVYNSLLTIHNIEISIYAIFVYFTRVCHSIQGGDLKCTYQQIIYLHTICKHPLLNTLLLKSTV